jgi:hypothetical protein
MLWRKDKSPAPVENRTPAIQLVACRYTYWATRPLINNITYNNFSSVLFQILEAIFMKRAEGGAIISSETSIDFFSQQYCYGMQWRFCIGKFCVAEISVIYQTSRSDLAYRQVPPVGRFPPVEKQWFSFILVFKALNIQYQEYPSAI